MTPAGAEWVEAFVAKASRALGLNAWGITTIYDTEPNPETGADATCLPDVRYLTADIRIRPACVVPERMASKVLLVHELLHVALVYVDTAHEQQVNQCVKARWLRQNMLRAHGEWMDHAVTRLARQLAPLIDQWDGVDRWWSGEPDDAEGSA